ncbi:hypothetical protein [Streptomyces sp. ML-6]|uniref:hypothetical protein n=1 Tax=Streptomyces sp. ML-6 TaxID=2982693 RepID=UPI0024BF7660|nr:hypothetical protein [Streptomyces sp. ML-6]MDK0519097.1 hypothetical protein [Streptomyces sp. ML-6]
MNDTDRPGCVNETDLPGGTSDTALARGASGGETAPAPGEARPRRWWPGVLLLAVLVPAVGGAVAVEWTAGVLVREGTRPLRVTYEVTGTARDVTVTYPAWQDGGLSTARLSLRSLPWTGEVRTRGFLRGGSLAVTVGRSGGEVSCAVTVDDGTVRTASASGAFATATCDGF